MGLEIVNGWVVHRIFSELRFQATPKFFDEKNKILQSLLLEYPQYDISKGDLLTMQTADIPGIEVKVLPNRFLLDYGNLRDFRDFCSVCQTAWRSVFSILDVSIVERFGVRATIMKEMSANEVNEFIKLFINTERVQSKSSLISGEVTLIFAEMERKAKITLKPGNFNSIKMSEHGQEVESVKGVLIDFDYFCEKISSSAAIQQFQYSVDSIIKYVNQLVLGDSRP